MTESPIKTEQKLPDNKWSSANKPIVANWWAIKNNTTLGKRESPKVQKYQEVVNCQKDEETVSNWDESEMGDDETDQQLLER